MTPTSKSAPPPLAARAVRPTAVRLRGSAVKILGAAAALVLAGAFTWAFVLEPALGSRARGEPSGLKAAGEVRPSDRISGRAAAYDALPPPRSFAAPSPTSAAAAAQTAPLAPPAAPPDLAQPPRPPPAARGADGAAGDAPVFFDGPAPARRPLERAYGIGAAGALVPADAPLQASEAAGYSRHRLTAPISPYEIKAGALIPAALLTRVDTGRPGPVVAVTTEPVFDTVSGRVLLLPQGSRLLGEAAGDSAYGERRAYLVWKRLILPDGRSLMLEDEIAADGAGAAGLPGRAERRLLQLGGAALVSAAISAVGELARGGRERRRASVLPAIGDAAAGQAVALGGRFLDREMEVQPRIVVEAGARVAVLVTKDLVLEPAR